MNERGSATWQASLILAIAQRADEAAFAELFGFFAPKVKAFLVRGGAAAEEAEECSQETLLAVWRRASQFDPERAAPSTWIFAIARNVRIDAARRRILESVDEEDAEQLPGASDSAEAMAEARQRAERVRSAIARLPEDQARVVLMSFYAGRAHAELAESLGLPLGTVKSRLRIAFDKLRSVLGEFSE